MNCESIVKISLLTLYLSMYFGFLNTKHGRIFVYKIYGDEEALGKIRIEINDVENSLILGIGLVVIGVILIGYSSKTICQANV